MDEPITLPATYLVATSAPPPDPLGPLADLAVSMIDGQQLDVRAMRVAELPPVPVDMLRAFGDRSPSWPRSPRRATTSS